MLASITRTDRAMGFGEQLTFHLGKCPTPWLLEDYRE